MLVCVLYTTAGEVDLRDWVGAVVPVDLLVKLLLGNDRTVAEFSSAVVIAMVLGVVSLPETILIHSSRTVSM